VLTDKHKLLLILVNLISNAKYAMAATPPDERRLTVRLAATSAERFRLEVQDQGMGIAPEMLTRIFQYGFTTRAEGHGFGLHSSALAAQELGGSLTAHSAGPGTGATFTLELPYLEAQAAA
jgi:C4-dicarboxylate-specific signal transduction histidine kinase